jgi:hypothetical protein
MNTTPQFQFQLHPFHQQKIQIESQNQQHQVSEPELCLPAQNQSQIVLNLNFSVVNLVEATLLTSCPCSKQN